MIERLKGCTIAGLNGIHKLLWPFRVITNGMNTLREGLITLYGEREAANIIRLVGNRADDPKIAERLLSGEPVQYVLGEAWFRDLRLKVDKRVLIPRPETEELVEWIIQDGVRSSSSTSDEDVGPLILDIGTGSGCIALALKKELPDAEVFGIDISYKALDVASANAEHLGLEVRWLEMDVIKDWGWLPPSDIIVSNPPYVLRSEEASLADNVRKFEPRQALFVPDDDPLLFYDTLAVMASELLQPGGRIYVETHADMAQRVAELFRNEGLTDIVIRKDLSGKDRMVRAGRS